MSSHPARRRSTLTLAESSVQRYEYAESRRPAPSPLRFLSTSNKLLNDLASPLLHRRATAEGHGVCLDGRRCAELHNLSFQILPIASTHHWDPSHHPRLTHLQFRGGATPRDLISPTLRSLSLKRMYAPILGTLELPALHSVTVSQVHSAWLERLSALLSVRKFTVSIAVSAMVRSDLPVADWAGTLFDRVETFVLEAPPSRQLEKQTPLELAVAVLKVNPSSVPLLLSPKLTLSRRSLLHHRFGHSRSTSDCSSTKLRAGWASVAFSARSNHSKESPYDHWNWTTTL